jgi:hypothetical protein
MEEITTELKLSMKARATRTHSHLSIFLVATLKGWKLLQLLVKDRVPLVKDPSELALSLIKNNNKVPVYPLNLSPFLPLSRESAE